MIESIWLLDRVFVVPPRQKVDYSVLTFFLAFSYRRFSLFPTDYVWSGMFSDASR